MKKQEKEEDSGIFLRLNSIIASISNQDDVGYGLILRFEKNVLKKQGDTNHVDDSDA